MGRGGLRAWLKGGAARGALALAAFGVGALASAPAQACYTIQNGSIVLLDTFFPPCGPGLFDTRELAEAALNAMNMGGPSTTPVPTATPTAPTTTPGAPTPVSADNVRQLLGSPVLDALGADTPWTAPNGLQLGSHYAKDGRRDVGKPDGFFVSSSEDLFYWETSITDRVSSRGPSRSDDQGKALFGLQLGLRYAEYARRRDADEPDERMDGGKWVPAVGTGKSAAVSRSDPETGKTDVVVQGGSENGLRHGVRVEIPADKPLSTGSSQGESALATAAVLLFGEEERAADVHRELTVANPAEATPERVRRIAEGLRRLMGDTEAGKPLNELIEDTKKNNPVSASGETRKLKGGAALVGESPPDARLTVEADGCQAEGGFSCSVELAVGENPVVITARDLAGGAEATPVIAVSPFRSDAAKGGTYAVDVEAIKSQLAAPCSGRENVCGPLREIHVSVDDKQRVTVSGVQEAAPAAPGGAPSVILNEFSFTPGGSVQGTATLFQAPPQPAGLPPVRLPVAQVEAAGSNLKEAVQQASGPLFNRISNQASGQPTETGAVRARGDEDLIVLRGTGGRPAWIDVSAANLGPDYKLSKDAPVSLVPGGFNLFSFDQPVVATPAQIQPDGSAASLFYYGPVLGGAGVTSNGVQFSTQIELKGEGLDSLAPPPADENERVRREVWRLYAEYLLDTFVIDPRGFSGSATAGEPRAGEGPRPLSKEWFEQAERDRARGMIRVYKYPRSTPRRVRETVGELELQIRGVGFGEYEPDYSVNVNAKPPATSIFQHNRVSIVDKGSAADGAQAKAGAAQEPAKPTGTSIFSHNRVSIVDKGRPADGAQGKADAAQEPATPGATSIFGYNRISIVDNAITADFDVDVGGAKRLAEQACSGAGLDCAGAVRHVAFSFSAPGDAPTVEVTVGLDAEGRPAPRSAEMGGVLVLTLTPNGDGAQASAKLLRVAPDASGRNAIQLVDVAPPVAVAPSAPLQEPWAQAMVGALSNVAAGGGQVALNQPTPGVVLPAAAPLPPPTLR